MPETPAAVPTRAGAFLLLAAIMVAAACAIVYELLIGSTSSYFLGNSVEQYSLTIGFFLFAMGIGSWLSRLMHEQLLARFIALEIWLGLLGGSAVAILYAGYAYTSHYQYLMLVLVLAIGMLIGLEVPLITRILRGFGPLRTTLSDVLSLDYMGSLLAALLFPYLLLPFLGVLHTSVAAGLVNVGVGCGVLVSFRRHLRRGDLLRLSVLGALVTAALVTLLAVSEPLVQRWESSLYEDVIVHNEQSSYQRIVLSAWKDEVRLFLDGHLQFASVDHHRYHESLVHPAMAAAAGRERVLIIGGGDGLAAAEVLKYADVRQLDLVDLDPAVTILGSRDLRLTRLNANSLNDPRVTIANEDGFVYLQRSHSAYGVIIFDLPDPREEALGKLYSVSGYRLSLRHLAPGGVIVTQASSPYYVREAYWSIAATLEAAGLAVVSYHLWVPSFGDWGFHLARRRPVDPLALEFEVERRFLRREEFRRMLHFDAETARIPVEPNRLDQPRLSGYYRQGMAKW